jgi:tetratricopeptide (TPR) repeat protein
MATALSARASQHYRRGAHDAALKDFTTAIEVEPENAELYLKRGSAWIDNKEFARAVLDFDKATQLAPNDSRGFVGRANAWYDQGELNKSLIDWNDVVKLLPDNSYAYPSKHGIFGH